MSTADLHAALETKLAGLLAGPDKRTGILVQQSPDSLDQTQAANDRDLSVTLLNQESELSRRVRSALRRIEEGTYGMCLRCEDPISEKRLRAVPWAELCLSCQENFERGRVPDSEGELGIELRG